MGFMDKAKKLAEQAQEKLDEQQAKLNQRGSGDPPAQGSGTPGFDQHGRPIQSGGPPPTPGPGSPLPPAPPVHPDDDETPAAPGYSGEREESPAGAGSPNPPKPPSPPSGGGMKSGDPLAG